ncbi:hypothetical protein [Limosilactobacillus equigenerosi]|uniref:hypothetical protein n=1 Tax=Limosilactobacillus equigenerosi TaxID=417373 RepID=UPI0006D10D06|nr:hypothetical protein [Limosilactobacillus equigenerosi]
MTTTKIDQHFANWVAQQTFQPAKQKALLAASQLFSTQATLPHQQPKSLKPLALVKVPFLNTLKTRPACYKLS